jgi:spore maturation protein CgeB
MMLSFGLTKSSLSGLRFSHPLLSRRVRVLILDTYYGSFLQQHYAQRPGLAREPYEEQLRSLVERSFAKSDAFSRGFRRLGYEASEVIVNCSPLQVAWAREHGTVRWLRELDRVVPHTRPTRLVRYLALQRIAQAQIEATNPDVLYVHDTYFPALPLLDWASRRGCFVAGQIASLTPRLERLRRFDLLFTSFPHFVERFRSLGVDAEYLRIAFDPLVLERLRRRGVSAEPDAERPHEASFVGGLDPGWHGSRTGFLEDLCERREVDVWGYGADALRSGSPILRCYHGEAWGLDMYEILARSRIAINCHIDTAEGRSNNMRLYEATGVGALLFTEASPNLDEILEPEREVVAYTDLDDLMEKALHFLKHDEERRAVAAAGQARTLRDHTYETRIEELATALEARLS